MHNSFTTEGGAAAPRDFLMEKSQKSRFQGGAAQMMMSQPVYTRQPARLQRTTEPKNFQAATDVFDKDLEDLLSTEL